MPTISRFYGIKIMIHWRDHPPPHFHAVYGEHEAQLDIVSMTVLSSDLPARSLRMVREWAALHRAELVDDWERAGRREALVMIEPLR